MQVWPPPRTFAGCDWYVASRAPSQALRLRDACMRRSHARAVAVRGVYGAPWGHRVSVARAVLRASGNGAVDGVSVHHRDDLRGADGPRPDLGERREQVADHATVGARGSRRHIISPSDGGPLQRMGRGPCGAPHGEPCGCSCGPRSGSAHAGCPLWHGLRHIPPTQVSMRVHPGLPRGSLPQVHQTSTTPPPPPPLEGVVLSLQLRAARLVRVVRDPRRQVHPRKRPYIVTHGVYDRDQERPDQHVLAEEGAAV